MGKTTLSERIEEVLRLRSVGQRELSTKAGLSSGHIGAILTRLRKDPSRNIEERTLRQIATAAAVSFEWLATGEGEPEPRGQIPTLGGRSDWISLLHEARRVQPGVSDEAWKELADSYVHLAHVDAQLVAGLGRAIQDAIDRERAATFAQKTGTLPRIDPGPNVTVRKRGAR